MSTNYADFLSSKAHAGAGSGIRVDLPDFLFEFQRHLVAWALAEGRAAIFADCGLGKTPMQLAWADAVSRHTGRPVLILTPLAVSHQTVREGEKFGIETARSADGTIDARIVVTNYERLHHFNRDDFAGVVCDESSILKSFDGATRGAITEFMKPMPFRLLCTATAAPNDYIELGTGSEALGHLGYMDMLARFFKNDQNTSDTKRQWSNQGGAPKWRFKGHAEEPFWRWVCSWARALRRPSDYGFQDDGFILPPLVEVEHIVKSDRPLDGKLFVMPAVGLFEQRQERRQTILERCGKVADIIANRTGTSVVWCHLNDEGDELTKSIPGAVQVSGKDSDESKEEKFIAFEAGQINTLVTKPSIGAWGLNWQHCDHMTVFPSHSFEQYYQSVRRCWRFGQKRPVTVDVVATEGDLNVLHNLQRKAAASDRMFDRLVAHMNHALAVDKTRRFERTTEVPSWL